MTTLAAQTTFGRLFSFALAGGSGFVVDIGVLWLLLNFTPAGPSLGRILSIACAMLATYAINRTFTFGASGRPMVQEGARYSFVALLGASLNFLIYRGLLFVVPSLSPYAATFLSVALVTVFSWLGYSRFVFRR